LELRGIVEAAFSDRTLLGDPKVADAIRKVVELLDKGELAVIEPPVTGEPVVVNEWVKKAILLYFAASRSAPLRAGPFEYYDKVPVKAGFEQAGVRAVPGAIVRYGAFLEKGVVLMPSFVNIGARVGADTMIDTWATVGSCAWVGRRVHIAGGVGIGGVLEPPSAKPVVIEDDVLVGSRAMITEGARVGRGAVVGAGVILNPSIPVIDPETGQEVARGEVPPWCVAVMGSRERRFKGGTFHLPCVLIVKRLEEGRRHDKASLNAFLREADSSA
jgi:2,3,4,5-tetrahydropyridine-2-carboxylate N-succinyltransferase